MEGVLLPRTVFAVVCLSITFENHQQCYRHNACANDSYGAARHRQVSSGEFHRCRNYHDAGNDRYCGDIENIRKFFFKKYDN